MTQTQESDQGEGLSWGPMEADEAVFVLDTISKSFRASPFAGVIPNHMWHPVMKATVTGLLERGAMVLVARAAGRVVGYVMYENKGEDVFVTYTYVKDHARRLGVAKDLLARVGVVKGRRWFYQFKTPAAAYLTKGHVAVHCPESARRKAL